jgi:hypothetical protein
MAKVNISFDTENNKEIDCVIDGVKVNDITSISLYKYSDKVDLNITLEKQENNGLTVYCNVCASDKSVPNSENVGVIGDKKEFTIAKLNKSPFAKSVAAMFNRQ